jgi:hypothetical protein
VGEGGGGNGTGLLRREESTRKELCNGKKRVVEEGEG